MNATLPTPAVKPATRKALSVTLTLTIGQTDYGIEVFSPEDDAILWAVRMTKLGDDAATYDVAHNQDTGVNSCDCGDYTFRHADTFGQCKHILAAVQVGLLPAQRVNMEVVEHRASRTEAAPDSPPARERYEDAEEKALAEFVAKPADERIAIVLGRMGGFPASIAAVARDAGVSATVAKRGILARFPANGKIVGTLAPVADREPGDEGPGENGDEGQGGDSHGGGGEGDDADPLASWERPARKSVLRVLATAPKPVRLPALPDGRYDLAGLVTGQAALLRGAGGPVFGLMADALDSLARDIKASGAKSVADFQDRLPIMEADRCGELQAAAWDAGFLAALQEQVG